MIKIMMKKILLVKLVVVFCVSPLFAQSGGEESRVGTTAAPFLTMGVGAKGHALGHANSINISGAESIFWNPAGMAIKNTGDSYSSSFISVTEYFADVDIYGTGIVIPIGEEEGQSLGIGLHFVDYGRMDVTTVEQQDGTGATFGAHDLSIGISYAQKLTDSFHFGGSVKLIQQKIYDMSAEALAIDLGFLLETNYLNGLTIGASITNFGRDMQMSGINSETYVDLDPNSAGNNEGIIGNVKLDNWELPLSFKFGFMAPLIKAKNIELLLMSEVQQTNDNKLNIDSGSELSYVSKTVKFHMRAGYKDLLLGNNVDSHFTYGTGLTLKTSTGIGIGIDFAQVPFEYLGQTSIIDVKLYY
ncbi:MAG: hypothetical protein EBR32_00785 [Bacteroidetes bacterium]|jgi:hypothetical protein|nr:hypothetical protein [Bacteroidota bacterium]